MSNPVHEEKDLKIEHETSNAVLVKVDRIDAPFWIPYSQINRIVRYKTTGRADILMSAWIAEKKGLL